MKSKSKNAKTVQILVALILILGTAGLVPALQESCPFGPLNRLAPNAMLIPSPGGRRSHEESKQISCGTEKMGARFRQGVLLAHKNF